MKHYRRFLTSIVLGLTTLLSIKASADLQVFPTRILLTEKNKTAQVSLRHRGSKPMKYRITTVFYKMSYDGSMTPVTPDPATDQSAIPHIQFSPRVVTLDPNLEQVVRVLFKPKKNLEAGEYRAHLFFEDMDEIVASDKPSDSKTAQMTLKARLAIAVPVIVQKGNPKGSVELKDLKIIQLPDGKKAFSVEMIKAGPKNAFGDFRAYFTDQKGLKTDIGSVNGVSSYIEKRRAIFPLDIPKGFEIKNGRFTIDYFESASNGGALQASANIQIP